MKEFLTIFTPTFNRCDFLPKLYESLCKQTDKNFIWLIIDDGSTDKTSYVVKKWIAAEKIKIIYIYQKNMGKHIAHNRAVGVCSTDLFMCVDSDDRLDVNAVEIIHGYWHEDYPVFNNIAGYCTKRRGGDSRLNEDSKNWPKVNSLVYAYDLSNKYHYTGETALVWITRELKNYRFPFIEGERFVTEIVLYFQFQKPMKIKNDVFYSFEYQPDGYTNKGFKLMFENPIGTAIMFKYIYLSHQYLFKKIKNMIKFYSWVEFFDIDRCMIDKLIKPLYLPYNARNHSYLDFIIKPLGYLGCYFYWRKRRKLYDK